MKSDKGEHLLSVPSAKEIESHHPRGEQVVVTTRSGERFSSYVSRPSERAAPGLLVLPEIYNVNFYLRAMCDWFAELGYVAMAPDVYWRIERGVELGYTRTDFERAFQYYQELKFDKATDDLSDAVAVLRRLSACNGRVGALGYCLGGRLAYLVAATGNIDAAVSLYGVSIESELHLASQIQCPIMFHFGETDEHVSASVVKEIRTAFSGRNNAVFHIYPDAGHAFAAPHRATYDPEATRLCYGRTMRFLKDVLFSDESDRTCGETSENAPPK